MGLFSIRRNKNAAHAPNPDQIAIEAISQKLARLREVAGMIKGANEEITKVQLIFPFLVAFGWDVTDPRTGMMEVNAGRNNRADIMLKRNEVVKVVIEAKRIGRPLDEHYDQLMSYFMNCKAWIGILTDGVIYQFYSFDGDTDWMDTTPFAVIDIHDPKIDSINSFMLHFRKSEFNPERIAMLGQAPHTRLKLGGKTLDPNDHNVRAAFQKDFPQASPGDLDELIEFANTHYYYQ